MGEGNYKLQHFKKAVLESPDAERVYRQDVALDELLGQGDSLYVQGRLYYVDANCSISIELWTGASFTERPYDAGMRVKIGYIDGSGTTQTNQDTATYTAVGPIRVWVEGTLRGDVEVVVKLTRTSGTGIRRVELETVAAVRST